MPLSPEWQSCLPLDCRAALISYWSSRQTLSSKPLVLAAWSASLLVSTPATRRKDLNKHRDSPGYTCKQDGSWFTYYKKPPTACLRFLLHFSRSRSRSRSFLLGEAARGEISRAVRYLDNTNKTKSLVLKSSALVRTQQDTAKHTRGGLASFISPLPAAQSLLFPLFRRPLAPAVASSSLPSL